MKPKMGIMEVRRIIFAIFSLQGCKHAGKEWEPAHGLELYDFGARHLDPVLGRFTTPDPAANQYPSISPYAYCAANPLRTRMTGNTFSTPRKAYSPTSSATQATTSSSKN